MAEETAIFEVKEYMVILRQLEEMDFEGQQIRLRGIVRCLGDDHTLDVYFLEEGSPVPEPVAKIDQKKGFLFMPYPRYPRFGRPTAQREADLRTPAGRPAPVDEHHHHQGAGGRRRRLSQTKKC